VLDILLKRQHKTGRTPIVKRGTVFIAEHSEPRDDLVDRIGARDGDDSWITPGDMRTSRAGSMLIGNQMARA
jgi:hypothetical protein